MKFTSFNLLDCTLCIWLTICITIFFNQTVHFFTDSFILFFVVQHHFFSTLILVTDLILVLCWDFFRCLFSVMFKWVFFAASNRLHYSYTTTSNYRCLILKVAAALSPYEGKKLSRFTIRVGLIQFNEFSLFFRYFLLPFYNLLVDDYFRSMQCIRVPYVFI